MSGHTFVVARRSGHVLLLDAQGDPVLAQLAALMAAYLPQDVVTVAPTVPRLPRSFGCPVFAAIGEASVIHDLQQGLAPSVPHPDRYSRFPVP